jgi:uncharacterized membrane protein YoaK (UPF0700 family)
MASSAKGHVGASNKYRSAPGRDFDVSLAELADYHTSRTRDRIAYITLISALAATGIAGLYGLGTGNFSGLNAVWVAAGPIVGIVIGYYFHRGRKEPG